jgi:hypothetical protein
MVTKSYRGTEEDKVNKKIKKIKCLFIFLSQKIRSRINKLIYLVKFHLINIVL